MNLVEPLADYCHVGFPKDFQLVCPTCPPSKVWIELDSVDLCFVLERADLMAAPSVRVLQTEEDVRIDPL